jgi:hypothetical protein
MCDCLFPSHLSQGYCDLRISIDKRFKILKGVKVDCLWKFKFRKLRENLQGFRALEALRKSSELPILIVSAFSSTEEQLKRISIIPENIPLP